MAQAKKAKRHASALKADRQSERRSSRNRLSKKSVRLAVRAVMDAIAKKDAGKIPELLAAASSALGKAAQRRTMHWKTAARKKSRLAARVARMAAAAPASAA